MPAPKFDLVLIDFDGTLGATRAAIAHCVKATLLEVTGSAPSDSSVLEVISSGAGLEDTFRTLIKGTLDLDSVSQLIKSYRARYDVEGDPRTTMFPGWRDVLSALSRLGVAAVVVSNKGIKSVLSAVNQFGIADRVALVIGDTPGIPTKPDPAVFHALIQPRYPEVERERILVVGDTDADIRFARNIEAASCWASYGYGRREVCSALKPDYTIESPSSLLKVIAEC
jgi:phosphoglycolate phosphatase